MQSPSEKPKHKPKRASRYDFISKRDADEISAACDKFFSDRGIRTSVWHNFNNAAKNQSL